MAIKYLHFLYNEMTLLSCSICRHNTRSYNLVSVPQITRLSLGDATIASKADLHNGNRKEKRSYGKVRNIKAILKILAIYSNSLSAMLLQFKI